MFKKNYYTTTISSSQTLLQATMWDSTAVAFLGMSADVFNDLPAKDRKTASLNILDRPVDVTMYISNAMTKWPTFTIKTIDFSK